MYFLICLGVLIISCFTQPCHLFLLLDCKMIQFKIMFLLKNRCSVLVQKIEKVGNNLTPKESFVYSF